MCITDLRVPLELLSPCSIEVAKLDKDGLVKKLPEKSSQDMLEEDELDEDELEEGELEEGELDEGELDGLSGESDSLIRCKLC